MDKHWAERIVKTVLEDVKATPGVGGVRVPHSFTIGAIEATESPNAFGGLSTWETRAKLSLPVIYSYTTDKGTHLPADRSNLDELRELLEGAAPDERASRRARRVDRRARGGTRAHGAGCALDRHRRVRRPLILDLQIAALVQISHAEQTARPCTPGLSAPRATVVLGTIVAAADVWDIPDARGVLPVGFAFECVVAELDPKLHQVPSAR